MCIILFVVYVTVIVVSSQHCLRVFTNANQFGTTLNDIHGVQWRTQEFFSGGGVQQIQLRTEDREEGDLGAVAP